jgi:exopolyphosphatase/guanosine-5'-triphosphate,3'-diphosphate pyrophosphatase
VDGTEQGAQVTETSGAAPAPGKPISLASVDLGSNSFHMVIARTIDHELRILDRIRDPVRLAAGLDAEGRLTEEAQRRALACLERFGERLREIPTSHVRVVGTNTLRRARNAREFQGRAEEALGHAVEVISGKEEARLVYLGVAHSVPGDSHHRLVVDIGGGSTEVIVGEGFEVIDAHSFYVGCVTMSRRHFPEGRVTRDRFREAETAAALELRTIERRIRALGWQACIGASGTIAAIAEILRQAGWSSGGITLAGLKKLRRVAVRAGDVDGMPAAMRGLKPERASVLPGGLAILIALFKSLEIEAMRESTGALREGVLYDLIGRIRHEDVRDRTIRRFVDRYRPDVAQAARVERTALRLLQSVIEAMGGDREGAERFLVWASRLHEVGLAVSYAGFHKHGAYLVAHSEMPGFAADDQALLAALIRGHRRRLSRSLFGDLSAKRSEFALRLCVLLRLAVLLNRSRVAETIPRMAVDEDWSRITLTFPCGWLAAHPLTAADLGDEASYLRAIGCRLEVVDADAPGAAPSA